MTAELDTGPLTKLEEVGNKLKEKLPGIEFSIDVPVPEVGKVWWMNAMYGDILVAIQYKPDSHWGISMITESIDDNVFDWRPDKSWNPDESDLLIAYTLGYLEGFKEDPK